MADDFERMFYFSPKWNTAYEDVSSDDIGSSASLDSQKTFFNTMGGTRPPYYNRHQHHQHNQHGLNVTNNYGYPNAQLPPTSHPPPPNFARKQCTKVPPVSSQRGVAFAESLDNAHKSTARPNAKNLGYPKHPVRPAAQTRSRVKPHIQRGSEKRQSRLRDNIVSAGHQQPNFNNTPRYCQTEAHLNYSPNQFVPVDPLGQNRSQPRERGERPHEPNSFMQWAQQTYIELRNYEKDLDSRHAMLDERFKMARKAKLDAERALQDAQDMQHATRQERMFYRSWQESKPKSTIFRSDDRQRRNTDSPPKSQPAQQNHSPTRQRRGSRTESMVRNTQSTTATLEMYNRAWESLGPRDPRIPFPTSTLTRDILSSAPLLARPRILSFFLHGADIAVYENLAQVGSLQRTLTAASFSAVKRLAEQTKQERMRWHPDKLGGRNNGKEGVNTLLRDDEIARCVLLATCDLYRACETKLSGGR